MENLLENLSEVIESINNLDPEERNTLVNELDAKWKADKFRRDCNIRRRKLALEQSIKEFEEREKEFKRKYQQKIL